MSELKKKGDGVQKKLGMSLDELIAAERKPTSQPKVGKNVKIAGIIKGIANNTGNAGQQQLFGPIRKQNAGPSRISKNNSPYAQQDFRGAGAAGGALGMGFTVKVTGLPRHYPWDQVARLLKAHFGVCGRVARVIPVGQAPGQGYVVFTDTEACRTALLTQQNATIAGHRIAVFKGIPAPLAGKDDAPGNYQRVAASPYGAYNSGFKQFAPVGYANAYAPYRRIADAGYPYLVPANTRNNEMSGTGATVIVTNVPNDLSASEISSAFSCVGPVSHAEILLNSAGVHTGRVAVRFARRPDAEEAVRRFDGGDLNGQAIRAFIE